MANGAFYIIILGVAVFGILTGYRKGLLRQAGGLLGVAFGIVAVKAFAPSMISGIENWLPSAISGFKREFLIQSLSCGFLYLAVSSIVQLCCIPLNAIMHVMDKDVVSGIAGAVFRAFKYLMVVSIFYNVIIEISPSSSLAKTACHHDGNIVEGVMQIAPAILGFPGPEEVGFRQQLEDAKKIS